MRHLWKRFYSSANRRKWMTIKEAISSSNKISNQLVATQGWIKSVRQQKNMLFIDINDGSCLNNLQAISPVDKLNLDPLELSMGGSVRVEGVLMASSSTRHNVELVLSSVNMLGSCDPKSYPFKLGTRHGPEYTRQFPHLRCRTNSFSSVLRVRNTATMAVHEYFQRQGFILVHTPIITSSDCEGAGDLFQLQSSTNGSHFFQVPTYLTVSGQLHAETIACGMSKVYTFGPTFRAENSHTRKHLSEFYMIEAEIVSRSDGSEDLLQELMKCSEDLVKEVTDKVLKSNEDDVKFLHLNDKNKQKLLDKVLNVAYKRLPYMEAIEILQAADKKQNFEFKPQIGSELASEHEKYLVEHHENVPLFVTDFPIHHKPFYTKPKDADGDTNPTVNIM
jgi:asparaginyl-tRNA synthetase